MVCHHEILYQHEVNIKYSFNNLISRDHGLCVYSPVSLPTWSWTTYQLNRTNINLVVYPSNKFNNKAISFPTNNFANARMPHFAITNNLSNKKNENLTFYQNHAVSTPPSSLPNENSTLWQKQMNNFYNHKWWIHIILGEPQPLDFFFQNFISIN